MTKLFLFVVIGWLIFGLVIITTYTVFAKSNDFSIASFTYFRASV